jgi:hypothetical protein
MVSNSLGSNNLSAASLSSGFIIHRICGHQFFFVMNAGSNHSVSRVSFAESNKSFQSSHTVYFISKSTYNALYFGGYILLVLVATHATGSQNLCALQKFQLGVKCTPSGSVLLANKRDSISCCK